MGDVTQSVEWQKDDPRVAEVRARLEEFRTALSRLGADEERQIGLRAADRLERALDTPSNQRDAIEGAADTIGLVGRTITAVAAAATAVHQAASGLF